MKFFFFIERYDSTSGNFTHESHPKKRKEDRHSTILECQDDVYVRLGQFFLLKLPVGKLKFT